MVRYYHPLKRRSYGRGKGSSTPRKAVQKYVKRTINARLERNVFFASRALATQSSTETALDLCAPAQGTGVQTRVGDKLQPQSLQLNIKIQGGTAANAQHSSIRLFIVRTKVEGTPVLSDLLEDNGAGIAPYSHYDTDGQNFMKVLYDRTFEMGGGTVSNDASIATIPIRDFGFRIKLSKKKLPAQIRFDPAATTAPNDKLWLISVGSSAAGSVSPSLQVESMCVFKE